MRCQNPKLLTATIAVALTIPVIAQTPPSTEPSTSTPLEINFANSGVDVAGSLVPLSLTISPPSVMLTAPPSTSELLLIMFDLDTPYGLANHSLAPYLHWLQPSIPSSGLSLASSNATQAPVAPYLHPQPPPISPPHRFVVLVYRQPQARFSMPPGWTGFGVEQNRSNFDVEAFQTAAGLGKPIAGTWFRVAPASSSAGNSSATASTAGISSASATSSTSTGNARTFAKAPLLIGSVMVAMVLLPGLLK